VTVHVLTIVSSYGVFALAMGLGHRHLILGLRGKLDTDEEERSAGSIYRVMQIVFSSGIGTVLAACGPMNPGEDFGAGTPRRPGP